MAAVEQAGWHLHRVEEAVDVEVEGVDAAVLDVACVEHRPAELEPAVIRVHQHPAKTGRGEGGHAAALALE